MTPRKVLLVFACLLGALTLLLVYNSFYKQETINAATETVAGTLS